MPDPELTLVGDPNLKANKAAEEVEQPNMGASRTNYNKKDLKANEIIRGKQSSKHSINKPIFDYRKDNHEKLAVSPNESKDKIKKEPKIETNVEKNNQKPIFDFRKK